MLFLWLIPLTSMASIYRNETKTICHWKKRHSWRKRNETNLSRFRTNSSSMFVSRFTIDLNTKKKTLHCNIHRIIYSHSMSYAYEQQQHWLSWQMSAAAANATYFVSLRCTMHEHSRYPFLLLSFFPLLREQQTKDVGYLRRIVPGCAVQLVRCIEYWRCRIPIPGGFWWLFAGPTRDNWDRKWHRSWKP